MPDWCRPEEYKHHLLLCVDVLLHADGVGGAKDDACLIMRVSVEQPVG